MIKSADIQRALAGVIRGAVPDLLVYFNHINSSDESYAWVQLQPARRDWGFGYFQRILRVNISVVLNPLLGEVNHSDLYAAIDAFDEAFSGGIWIGDRFITIYNTDANIFDDILHYRFELNFTDAVSKLTREQVNELMRDLQIKWSDRNVWEN